MPLFCRVFAGYFSARLYKTMKGVQWKKAAFQVRYDNIYIIYCQNDLIFSTFLGIVDES